MAAPKYFDRIKETTTTTGTGAFVLGGAPASYRTFASVLADGDTCYYGAVAVDASGVPTGSWEVGLGTFVAASDSLDRTLVVSSSNGGSTVSFAAGTKQVWLDAPAISLTRSAHVTGYFPGSAVAVSTGLRLFPGIDGTVTKMQAWASSPMPTDTTFSILKNGVAFAQVVVPSGQTTSSADLALPIASTDYLTAALSSGGNVDNAGFRIDFSL